MRLGRKIYYDKQTGNVLVVTSEMVGDVFETTLEDDVKAFTSLNGRNFDSFGVIKLSYGQYAEDFMQCSGVRVNLDTLAIEFSYPDPNQPEAPPVYQKPLTEQVNEIEERQSLMQQALDELLLGGMI